MLYSIYFRTKAALSSFFSNRLQRNCECHFLAYEESKQAVIPINASVFTWTVIIFVERSVGAGFDYAKLEKETGFSLSHIRATFAKQTGNSLSRYVLSRRIANAAFEIVHTERSLFDIAITYGFKHPDSFTRAFRRVTGVNPSDFRKEKHPVGRKMLCPGVYGVSIS